MEDEKKLELLKTSWKLHDQVEAAYLSDETKKRDSEWLEKQRFLLADMSLHLLQTAIKPGEIKLERLRDNLYAILTISDQFLPEVDLINTTKKLYKK
ncbi:hypothetical protein [Tenacibaculum ovolyticum]|uniref:hypothetical protein n=1 Tax=Tenacibaculum ovolyticum TaxID=104270 RepID=UPI001F442A2D|nr:hypothetical protein [Tenacibaculum ovolyticum]